MRVSHRRRNPSSELLLNDRSSVSKLKMPCLRHFPLCSFLLIAFVSIAPCSTGGQPFLNSLAVLFRARPPWPTTFPSAKFPPMPSPLMSNTQQSQHGILVAHPLNPAPNFDPMNKNANNNNNNNNNNINSNGPFIDDSKSKKPDTIGSDSGGHQVHPQPPAPSPQQNFVPIPSLPTLSPLIPLFPPPMSMFHNNHVLGAGHSRLPHPGGNNHNHNHHGHHHGNHHNHHNKGMHHHHPSIPGPLLVSSPTSIVGSYSFPEAPSTVPNPNYGVLLENTNSFHKNNNNNNNNNPHHKKHKQDFRANAWNPLLVPLNHNNNNNNNNNNNGNGNNGGIGQVQGQSNGPNQIPSGSNGPVFSPNVNLQANDNNVNNKSNGSRSERQRKQKKLLLDFRPSPQLNSYVETTVISDYGSHVQANNYNQQKEHFTSKEANPEKSASNEAKTYPRFESGFRPISGDQYAAGFGTTSTRPHYTNSKQQYFNPWSIAFDPNQPGGPSNQSQVAYAYGEGQSANSIPSRGEKPFRQDRQILTKAAADVNGGEDGSSSEEDDPLVFFGNRGRKKSSEAAKGKSRHRFSSKGKKLHGVSATLSSTTASSELVEEWLPPGVRIEKKSDTNGRKFPIFNKVPNGPRGMAKLPDKCNKFSRFGFCPVTKQYPLNAAEAIASRCSALLSHLIAPLPKMDVQYDIGSAEGKNGTTGKGRSSGWSWRSYQGKPVCDTDEITTVPGWAKNENGEWMIILQTKIWQQKAHISLCSPSATHCTGLACTGQANSSSGSTDSNASGQTNEKAGSQIRYTKCVQRFTAQRLAVFDPENPDRCPVVRSVFLPSACVCLSNTVATGPPDATPNPAPNPNSPHKRPAPFPLSLPARQPLFATNEDDLVHYGDDSASGSSVESLLAAKTIIGRTPRSQSQSTSTLNASQGESGSTEGKQSIQPPHPHRTQSPPNGTTFMIITEKFSTSESSKESAPLLSPSTEILPAQNGTQVSN